MLPDRLYVVVLAVILQLIDPELVPLAPDVINNQSPVVTFAVHDMVPAPVLETLNTAVPDELFTFRADGLTESDCAPS